MQKHIEAIQNKVQEVLIVAEKKFGKMPEVNVRFDLRGRAAGQAQWRNSYLEGPYAFQMRFNREHIAMGGQTLEHMINDVVAHEVAHIVCAAKPHLGKNHNPGWKLVCRELGGNGERCYDSNDAPEAVAKQSPYIYMTSNGYEVRVTKRTHNKIQRQFASYRFKGGKGSISKSSNFRFEPNVVELATPYTEQRIEKPAPKRTVKRTAPKATGSKADRIRAQIAQGKTQEECIEFGINVLGMKRALAKTYVKNNWNK